MTDFRKYNLSLNVRAIMLFEHISGHNFFKMSTAEDILLLAYCGFIYSNNLKLTYKAFQYMAEDKKFCDWITDKLEDEIKYVQQYMASGESDSVPEKTEEVPTLTQMVDYMIANGIDINYVMEKMELWELDGVLNAIQSEKKSQLESERLWAYVGVMPLVDSKKVKSPSDLIPFPWEKEAKKKKAQEDIDSKKHMISQFFKAQEEAKKNGNN